MRDTLFKIYQIIFVGLHEIQHELKGSLRHLGRRPLVLALGLLCLAIVGLKKSGRFLLISPHDPATWAGRRGAITGVVAQHPDPRLTGCVYLVDVETGKFFDEPKTDISLTGRMLLHVVRSTEAAARPGNRIRFIGRIQKPATARLPGVFDYETYLQNHGVNALIYTSSSSLRILGPTESSKALRASWEFKQRILKTFNRFLKPEAASVLAGLAIGVRPRFHPDIKKIFTESGTMHILVASGSNVGFVIGFWFLFFHFLLRIPKKWALLLTLAPVWLYVFIVGLDPPITRAGLMATVGILAYVLMREGEPLHALVVAGLLILIVSPRNLFDVGFQMSFITVFGLIHFSSAGSVFTDNPSFWIRWSTRLILGTLTAQLWLIPITANVFHQFFPIGLIANIVMLPASGLGLAAGFVLAAAPTSFMPTLATCIHLYVESLIHLARYFSNLGSTVWLPSLNATAIGGFYLSCVSIVGVRRVRLCQIGVLSGLFLLYLGLHQQKPRFPNGLIVTWIDVGRTLNCLIQVDKEAVLVVPGAGDSANYAERTLMPFLTSIGVRSLKAIIVTRALADTPDNFLSLTQAVPTNQVMSLLPNRTLKLGRIHMTGLPAAAGFARPLLVTCKDASFVLSEVLSFAAQEALVKRNQKISLIQSRFSQKVRWKESFLGKCKPGFVVETGWDNEKRPSVSPWVDVEKIVPQKMGWWSWSPSLSKEKNAGETSNKSTGVRPPGHATDIASNR